MCVSACLQTEDFSSIEVSRQDLSLFKQQHAAAWADSIVHQTESAVETAVLLFYWRVPDLSLSQFERLLLVGKRGDFGVALQVLHPPSDDMCGYVEVPFSFLSLLPTPTPFHFTASSYPALRK